MTESPLFTGGPDLDEFKAELREIRERLDQLSADLATLSAQVQNLAPKSATPPAANPYLDGDRSRDQITQQNRILRLTTDRAACRAHDDPASTGRKWVIREAIPR